MSPYEVFRWIVDSIRRLFTWIVDSIHQLFTTPIQGWTWGQWFLMLLLLFLVYTSLSRCLCRSRRRRRRRYRNSNRNGGGEYENEDDEYEYENDYHAYNNHPGGRMVQSSVPMAQQTRPQQAPLREERKRQMEPPALAPYNLSV